MSGFPSVPLNVSMNPDAPAQAAGTFLNTFNTHFKQARLEQALKAAQSGDPKAIETLYALEPELALRLDERRRQDAATRAANDYYVSRNPGAKDAISAGANAKDLAALDYKGAQTDAASNRAMAVGFKTTYENYGRLNSMLGGVAPGDAVAGAQIKDTARKMFADSPVMLDYIDTLPDAMTPADISRLRNEAMTAQQQVQAEARNRGIDIQQQRADETERHNRQSEANTVRGQDVSRDNNIRSTTTSRDNNIRSTTQSNTNSERSAETTRGSASYSGRGGRGGRPAVAPAGGPKEGDIARNKRDGKLYVFRAGQWVPKQ